MAARVGLGPHLSHTLDKGVGLYRWISGLFVRRLTGSTGRYLTGANGRPLYGRTD